MAFNIGNIVKRRHEKLLDHNKSDIPSIVRKMPSSAEGSDGDMAVGATPSGIKLFAKIAGRWYSFSPDNTNNFKNVMQDNQKKEYIITNFPTASLRTYNANSATNDDLSDVLWTLIKDLSNLGILKLK
jgi:hypothetical protein